MTVLWGGKPAKDIPLKVDVKKAVDGDKITVIGDALQYGIVGKKEIVTVLASDSGLLKDGDLTATMTSVESLDNDVQLNSIMSQLYALQLLRQQILQCKLDCFL